MRLILQSGAERDDPDRELFSEFPTATCLARFWEATIQHFDFTADCAFGEASRASAGPNLCNETPAKSPLLALEIALKIQPQKHLSSLHIMLRESRKSSCTKNQILGV